MGGYWIGGLCVALLGACHSGPSLDLSRNANLYRPVGYFSKLPADRDVCLLPVVDERKPPAVEASGTYPVEFLPRGTWTRPVPVMVGEVLERDLAASHVFGGVQRDIRPQTCLLRVYLLAFEGGIEEHPTGRRSFARVAIRCELHGPQGAGGARQLWLSKDFGSRAVSEVVMRPTGPRVLLANGLRSVVRQMLAALDQSNLGRSGVPLHLGQ